MRECAFCGEEAVPEEMEGEKEKRLREDDTGHLEGETLHRAVCKNCGHVFYVRAD